MIIENAIDYKDCFKEDNIYVFTIGYEHRSYFLLDYLLEHYPSARKLILVLNDYINYPHVVEKINKIWLLQFTLIIPQCQEAGIATFPSP